MQIEKMRAFIIRVLFYCIILGLAYAVLKYALPFLLLSDPELEAIQAYDVWKEKKLYGKVSMGGVRTTYVIDEDGIIEKVFEKAKPDTNAAEILSYLKGE